MVLLRWNRLLIAIRRHGSDTGKTFTVVLPDSDDIVADINAGAIEPYAVEVPRATEGVAVGDGPSTAELQEATGGPAVGIEPLLTEVPRATEGVDEGDGY